MFFKAKINTDPQKVDAVLNRGTEDILIRENLSKQLLSGRQLRIKFGIDPTSTNIHIGRAVSLWKLKALQDLGHKIVLIVGDFTARIGDPSDKIEKRPMLTKEAINKNLTKYKEQIGKILDLSKVEWHYNSKWLSKLNFETIAEIAESFSVSQMLARRNFKDRHEAGDEISLREFLYPLMQGYDSVMVKSDVEVGGFDQLFNLKAGRIIQKHFGMKEQDCLTTKMILGTDGRKMSSSWGNIISLLDAPKDMFGKIMSLKDELIADYFLMCTDVSIEEIEKTKKFLENGGNPKDEKIKLAHKITEMYHGKREAEKAKENFEKTFSKKEIPQDIETFFGVSGESIMEKAVSAGVVSSKGEWKRLVDEGAITHMESGEKIKSFEDEIKEGAYRVGKKRFFRINIK